MTLNKQWNWSSYTRLALSAGSTHGLLSQSVRASEWNSVFMGSNPTQANILQLLQIFLQLWIPYYACVTLCYTLTKLLKRREIFVILINFVFFLFIYIWGHTFKVGISYLFIHSFIHSFIHLFLYIYIYIYIKIYISSI